MAQRQYVVIIEPSDTGFGAYVPDVPGCVAVADTRIEVEQLIREALETHLEMMVDSGEWVRDAVSEAITIDVTLPVVTAR